MNNERLTVLVEALVKLSEFWTKTSPGVNSHAIYSQIDFFRKLIREELKRAK